MNDDNDDVDDPRFETKFYMYCTQFIHLTTRSPCSCFSLVLLQGCLVKSKGTYTFKKNENTSPHCVE